MEGGAVHEFAIGNDNFIFAGVTPNAPAVAARRVQILELAVVDVDFVGTVVTGFVSSANGEQLGISEGVSQWQDVDQKE